MNIISLKDRAKIARKVDCQGELASKLKLVKAGLAAGYTAAEIRGLYSGQIWAAVEHYAKAHAADTSQPALTAAMLRSLAHRLDPKP